MIALSDVSLTIFCLQTLENLPSHLLTPFVGPVPPSNLLDKIARGVVDVKNSVEWPHSMRATRAKIVELARLQARDARDESASDTIVEEGSDSSDVPLQQTTNIGHKRPLYRQSSMDFMHPSKLDLKNNPNISRCVSLIVCHLSSLTNRAAASPVVYNGWTV